MYKHLKVDHEPIRGGTTVKFNRLNMGTSPEACERELKEELKQASGEGELFIEVGEGPAARKLPCIVSEVRVPHPPRRVGPRKIFEMSTIWVFVSKERL